MFYSVGGNAMRGQVFSDKEIQDAFHIAYILHPNTAVAYSVALDSIDRYFLQKRLQERRPKAKKKPFKTPLSDPALLQTSIYLASDLWERDQERLLPRKTPYYKPDVNDLIVRYVKFLIWETMERSSSHVAVGIGSFLYTYRTSEINNLAPDHFKDDNIRRIKAGILNSIKKRFEQHNIAPDYSSYLITRLPTRSERELVCNALTFFAPWVVEHASSSSDSGSILNTYFGYESKKSEWERNHALVDLQCAGLPLLISEFNANGSREAYMQLENPDEKLEVPDFGPGLDSDGNSDRFHPPSLSETEFISLRRSLEQNQRRREIYRPGRIRISVDGKEQMLVWENPTACDEFIVPSNASYLEVYGNDPSGELLLAVVPLTKLDLDQNEEIEVPFAYDDELTVSLSIGRNPKSDNDELSIRLNIKGCLEEIRNNESRHIDESKSSQSDPSRTGKKKTFRRASLASAHSVRRVLWFLAGAETEILEQEVCITERNKYSLMGTAVFISAFLAAIAGAYALYITLESLPIAMTLGLAWGLSILTFDRFLVLNTKVLGNESGPVNRLRHSLTHLAPRLLLTILLGLIITEPLLLRLFRDEINHQVALQNQANQVRLMQTPLFSEIDELETKIERLKSEVANKEAYRDEIYRESISEQVGMGSTRKYGAGPVAAERLRQLANVESELRDLRARNEEQMASLHKRLDYLNAERDTELAKLRSSGAQSNLLSRLAALSTLKSTNVIVQQISWVLLLLLILIESTPILMKVSFAKGLYDSVLESTVSYNYQRHLQELETRMEREVEEKIEDLKNVVNFYARSRAARL
jgi:hypothetical protein